MKIIFNDLVGGELGISLDDSGKLCVYLTERIPEREEKTTEAIFNTNAFCTINKSIALLIDHQNNSTGK